MPAIPAGREALLTLWCLLEQSDRAFHHLVNVFCSPEGALAAGPSGWREADIPPAKRAALERWQRGDSAESAAIIEASLNWLAEPGRYLLTPDHILYPALLRELVDGPPLLFVRGDPALLALPQIAIVGTRHPTRGGQELAAAFAAELAGRGLAITSGLALGIDAAAHAGALRARGVTIAVMGTGPDRLYPKSNLRLAEQMLAESGVLVSEFLPGTPPLAHHFPRRNRIISGLSLGVLVVEAAVQSGSLITARLAAEQGRNVWALPGSVHNAQAKGCHQLIREGVKLVEEAAHVLEDIGPLLGVLKEDLRQLQARAVEAVVPEGPAAGVLAALGWECRSLDWLVEATGRPAGELQGLLLQMELEGQVASVPGGFERLPG